MKLFSYIDVLTVLEKLEERERFKIYHINVWIS